MKRELLISFTGHILVILAIGSFTQMMRKPREVTRPGVITVEILRGGVMEKKEETPARPQLVEPAPKPVPKPAQPAREPRKKSQPRSQDDVLRRGGLGARIEGAQTLGYNFYLQQMLERISENWQDPYQGRTKTLTAMVFFVIQRDGRLTDVKLERSSGDVLFDEACTRAVIVTGKLPPLPEEFTAPQLKIHLEFEG